ncbi:MAG: hypothetical protein AAFY99_05130 [Pseudomonadota bacterium]
MKQIKLSHSDNLVENAAITLAACAYPKISRKTDSYANALTEYMWRCAKSLGKIDDWPAWVKTRSKNSLQSRLRTGEIQLFEMVFVYRLLLSLHFSVTSRKTVERKGRTTFTVRLDEELDNFSISIPYQELDNNHVELIGTTHLDAKATLRATILKHRSAFSQGDKDPEDFYQNFLKRRFKPALRVMPFLAVVHDVIGLHKKRILERNMPISLHLIRNPEWAADIGTTTRQKVPFAMRLAESAAHPIDVDELILFES